MSERDVVNYALDKLGRPPQGVIPGHTVGKPKPKPPVKKPPTTSHWYTIKQGDTLGKLAQRFYGDASKWRVIKNANATILAPTAGKDSDLKNGRRIHIPDHA